MSDFGTDKNTQFAEDKAKNKFDELAGSAQQQFGEFVDSPKHQVKGAAKKYAAQASDAVSGNDSNLLIVFYVQIMPDDFVMQLHRF